MGPVRRSIKLIALVLCVLASSCSWNNEAAKHRYFSEGQANLKAGKYREAELAFRKAIRRDGQFGEAYYFLGHAEFKQNKIPKAVLSLRKAATMMPRHFETRVLLGQIYFTVLRGDRDRSRIFQDLRATVQQMELLQPEASETLSLKAVTLVAEGKRPLALELFAKASQVKPIEPEFALVWAQALLVENQAAKAEAVALELLNRDPSFSPIYDLLYAHYRISKRIPEAEQIIKKKVANNPQAAGWRVQLAGHYASHGNPAAMKAVLDEILANPKNFPTGRLEVGDFYSRLRQWPAAIENYRAGMEAVGAEKGAYQKRIAQVLFAQEKNTEALSMLDAVLRDHPEDRDAAAAKAVYQIESGKAAEALGTLRKLASEQPANPVFRYQLARAYLVHGDPQAARVQLREAIRHRNDLLVARVLLAETSINLGDYDEGLRQANEILALNPKQPRARLLHSAAQVGRGQPGVARGDLTELVKEFPRFYEAHLQLALANLAEGKFAAALAILNEQRSAGAGDLRFTRALVEVHFAQGHLDQAIQEIRAELARKPADASSLRRLLAATSARAGRLDAAIEEYLQILPTDPQPQEIHYVLSALYVGKDEPASALSHVQKAHQAAPRDARIIVTLGSLLERQGSFEEARKYYRQALAVEPGNALAMNNLAYNLAESGGSLDEALSLAQRSAQLRPNEHGISDTLGWIYLKRGGHATALQIFQNLAGKVPANPTYRYHLAMALVQTGDKARAKAELRAALSHRPSPQEKERIERMLSTLN